MSWFFVLDFHGFIKKIVLDTVDYKSLDLFELFYVGSATHVAAIIGFAVRAGQMNQCTGTIITVCRNIYDLGIASVQVIAPPVLYAVENVLPINIPIGVLQPGLFVCLGLKKGNQINNPDQYREDQYGQQYQEI
jgi:hypothetical protein